MKTLIFRLITCFLIGLMIYSILGRSNPNQLENYTVRYSDFIQDIRDGLVSKVTIKGETITGERNNGEKFITYNPDDPKLIDELLQYEVKIHVEAPEQESLLMRIFISWAPMLLLIMVWIYFMRRQQGGGMNNQMNFGKSKAKLMEEDEVKIRFDDVAGCEEAKEDVVETVDFLRDPSKYQSLGGQMPKGLLMVGPPGTGKTLLAKAIAGEAAVPFFSISGSDFVEMFVGVGASRVRDMFAEAKKKAPCIIFIDEIDAVGRQRGGSGMGGGSDEREQTLNQLLVEMDGFSGSEGIVVIAATNRSDVLDKALLRPGRFDREVNVGLPDINGREQILQVHIKKVPAADDVNLKDLARGTPGFTGAEIANLVNEGALLAARQNQKQVTMEDLDRARDKLIMGAERHTMIMTREDLLMTAYHEAGHTIVGRIVPGHDPVYKVSIMPRGGALGITMFLPERDQHSASKEKLESQIASLYGGRVAEELIYGVNKVTTGASNDIERATQLATNMVTEWGFSEKMGPRKYSQDQNQGYFGQDSKLISEKITQTIDDEINNLLNDNYIRAQQILTEHIDILHNMAHALSAWETLDKYQIERLMNGEIIEDPEPEHKAGRKRINHDEPEETSPVVDTNQGVLTRNKLTSEK